MCVRAHEVADNSASVFISCFHGASKSDKNKELGYSQRGLFIYLFIDHVPSVGHEYYLLDSQEYVRVFQSPLWISFPYF